MKLVLLLLLLSSLSPARGQQTFTFGARVHVQAVETVALEGKNPLNQVFQKNTLESRQDLGGVAAALEEILYR